jgi:hypothetical protein
MVKKKKRKDTSKKKAPVEEVEEVEEPKEESREEADEKPVKEKKIPVKKLPKATNIPIKPKKKSSINHENNGRKGYRVRLRNKNL